MIRDDGNTDDDVGNLAKWLIGQVCRRFLLVFREFNMDQLEWNFLFVENNTDISRRRREIRSVEFENHSE